MKKNTEKYPFFDKLNSNKIEISMIDVNKYINNVQVFNRFASTTNQVIYFVDYYTNHFFFVSDNTEEILGGDFTKNQSKDKLYIFKNLEEHVQKMLVQWMDLLTNHFKNNIEVHPNYEHFYCNFKLLHSEKNILNHYFIRDIALEHSKRGFPAVTMSSVQNINSLLVKDAPFWFRLCLDADKSKIYTYHSEKMKFVEGDILSPREFEFLSLINKGLDGKEIAAAMKIAYSTADNHRKNILSKLGARNPTAAIEILKNAGINL